MATSERWEELYAERDRTNPLRRAVQAADLFVGAYEYKYKKRHMLLNNGRRFIPFAFGYTGLAGKNFDPRRIAEFRNYVAPTYPGPADQQVSEIYPAGAIFGEPGTPYAGNVIGFQPWDPTAQPNLEGTGWYPKHGEYHPGSGSNSYWTNDEVEREIWLTRFYGDAYYSALYWWLLLHDMNPGSFLPYEDELLGAIQAIDIIEAGDPVMDQIVVDAFPPAPTPAPQSDTPYYVPGVTPGGVTYDPAAGGPVQAGMIPGLSDEHLPYVAAGAVVAFMLYRKYSKTGGQ